MAFTPITVGFNFEPLLGHAGNGTVIAKLTSSLSDDAGHVVAALPVSIPIAAWTGQAILWCNDDPTTQPAGTAWTFTPTLDYVTLATRTCLLSHTQAPAVDYSELEDVAPAGSANFVTGPRGIPGPKGDPGGQGIPGPVGPAGLNWRGAWSAATAYAVDDSVARNGASWFATAATLNVDPNPSGDGTTAAAPWALLAAEGAPGPRGIQGVPGPPGPPGTTGPLSLTALIAAGAPAVGNNVLPPGLAVGYATVINTVRVRCGTAPAGGPLTARVNDGGRVVATVTVAAGANTAQVTGLGFAAAAGDVITFDITAIGSTTPGSDVAVDLWGT